jgi:hypothetical protein
VAEKIGALLMVKPAKVDEGYLLDQSLEMCGEQAVWDTLRDAGAANSSIEKYRSVAAESRSHRKGAHLQRPAVATMSYEQLKALPAKSLYLLRKWGERASEEELERAAKGLLAARDSKQQLDHLHIFARRRFPRDVQVLVDLIGVEQDRVGRAALKALANLTHPAVRTLALQLRAVSLMAQNYQDGDHGIVLRWFQAAEDRETLHSMGMDLFDFLERHRDDSTAVLMLRSLYETGPCSECRERAVKGLMERGALTPELRAECA